MHCYTTLEQLEPAEPRWLHLHAAILAGYGEVLPAIELLEQVVQLAPSYRSAWLLLGDCRLKANQLDRAVEAYESCLKKFPDDPFAWLGLARIDLEKGRDDAARAKLENVVRLTNYQLGYDLIVSLYERAGMSAQAAAIRGSAKASGAYRDRPDPWLDELMVDCFDSYRVSVDAGTMARNGDRRGGFAVDRASDRTGTARRETAFSEGKHEVTGR